MYLYSRWTSFFHVIEIWHLSNVVLRYVMLCHVMLCHVIFCSVLLCYDRLCYVMLSSVMLCFARLWHVTLCYVMLWCVELCYLMEGLFYYIVLSFIVFCEHCLAIQYIRKLFLKPVLMIPVFVSCVSCTLHVRTETVPFRAVCSIVILISKFRISPLIHVQLRANVSRA